jgi:hypothetical protein
MQTTGILARSKNLHFYYRCPKRVRHGKEACPNRKNIRADSAEPRIWELVSGLLKEPERLKEDLDRMIELERKRLRCNPEKEAMLWAKRMAEYTAHRERRLQQHAKGLIGLDELREKLEEIDENCKVAEREFNRLRNLEAEIACLEKDKEALVRSYADIAPEALDALTPEERHRVYKMLRLEVVVNPDGTLQAAGVLASNVSKNEITSAGGGILSGPRRS